MQGIFINGNRPKSKKQIKELVANGQEHNVCLEATSLFGNEYSGNIKLAPNGRYHFVGPDPHTSRKFYGTITVSDGKIKVA